MEPEELENETDKIVEYSPDKRYGKLNTVLGKGAYKVVWKAIDNEEGIEVAWNCFQASKTDFLELEHEIEILKQVSHPNIINFHETWHNDTEFVFITELMTSGTLREYIRKIQNPNLKIIKRWSRQILKGLLYLHSHNPPIIHRDIKCDNIFINGAHGEVKIGDMGTAKMKFGKKYTIVGTPEFMAPEMYDEKGYSEKVDVYAFGMCLLEMSTGQYPYGECKNAAQIYKKVSQGLKPDCLADVEDPVVLSLINQCLAPENERISVSEAMMHPFLADDPEVSLISFDDTKTMLGLQVTFKGNDSMTMKFDFNVEKDTAENVVKEMIEENVIQSHLQGHIIQEIKSILRDLKHDDSVSEARKSPPAALEDVPGQSMKSESALLDSRVESPDYEPKNYEDSCNVQELVSEAARITQKTEEKSKEWLEVLNAQDIVTVGDLRGLHDEDWNNLDLTVFARRALKNALYGVKSVAK